jgi:hypothetical protein
MRPPPARLRPLAPLLPAGLARTRPLTRPDAQIGPEELVTDLATMPAAPRHATRSVTSPTANPIVATTDVPEDDYPAGGSILASRSDDAWWVSFG